jgi:hypothetical protein
VRRRLSALALLATLLLLGGAVGADEADRPEILHVTVLGPLAVGRPAELRVAYRARRANVAALVQVIEDLDGPHRATRQREFSVVARAFGLEAGELVVPIAFGTPGRKRVVVTLVTDERAESDPESVEVDVTL